MATVILGVCGSIAAYKAADVASRLVKAGHEVHCVCTPTALQFVTPLTLMTLSRNPVITTFEDETGSWVLCQYHGLHGAGLCAQCAHKPVSC